MYGDQCDKPRSRPILGNRQNLSSHQSDGQTYVSSNWFPQPWSRLGPPNRNQQGGHASYAEHPSRSSRPSARSRLGQFEAQREDRGYSRSRSLTSHQQQNAADFEIGQWEPDGSKNAQTSSSSSSSSNSVMYSIDVWKDESNGKKDSSDHKTDSRTEARGDNDFGVFHSVRPKAEPKLSENGYTQHRQQLVQAEARERLNAERRQRARAAKKRSNELPVEKREITEKLEKSDVTPADGTSEATFHSASKKRLNDLPVEKREIIEKLMKSHVTPAERASGKTFHSMAHPTNLITYAAKVCMELQKLQQENPNGDFSLLHGVAQHYLDFPWNREKRTLTTSDKPENRARRKAALQKMKERKSVGSEIRSIERRNSFLGIFAKSRPPLCQASGRRSTSWPSLKADLRKVGPKIELLRRAKSNAKGATADRKVGQRCDKSDKSVREKTSVKKSDKRSSNSQKHAASSKNRSRGRRSQSSIKKEKMRCRVAEANETWDKYLSDTSPPEPEKENEFAKRRNSWPEHIAISEDGRSDTSRRSSLPNLNQWYERQ